MVDLHDAILTVLVRPPSSSEMMVSGPYFHCGYVARSSTRTPAFVPQVDVKGGHMDVKGGHMDVIVSYIVQSFEWL